MIACTDIICSGYRIQTNCPKFEHATDRQRLAIQLVAEITNNNVGQIEKHMAALNGDVYDIMLICQPMIEQKFVSILEFSILLENAVVADTICRLSTNIDLRCFLENMTMEVLPVYKKDSISMQILLDVVSRHPQLFAKCQVSMKLFGKIYASVRLLTVYLADMDFEFNIKFFRRTRKTIILDVINIAADIGRLDIVDKYMALAGINDVKKCPSGSNISYGCTIALENESDDMFYHLRHHIEHAMTILKNRAMEIPSCTPMKHVEKMFAMGFMPIWHNFYFDRLFEIARSWHPQNYHDQSWTMIIKYFHLSEVLKFYNTGSNPVSSKLPPSLRQQIRQVVKCGRSRASSLFVIPDECINKIVSNIIAAAATSTEFAYEYTPKQLREFHDHGFLTDWPN